MLNCPRCGAAVHPDADFCPICGLSRDEPLPPELSSNDSRIPTSQSSGGIRTNETVLSVPQPRTASSPGSSTPPPVHREQRRSGGLIVGLLALLLVLAIGGVIFLVTRHHKDSSATPAPVSSTSPTPTSSVRPTPTPTSSATQPHTQAASQPVVTVTASPTPTITVPAQQPNHTVPAWPSSINKTCSPSVAVNDKTTCPFALNVASDIHDKYPAGVPAGASFHVNSWSDAKSKWYDMACQADNTGMIVCTGGNDAKVFVRS